MNFSAWKGWPAFQMDDIAPKRVKKRKVFLVFHPLFLKTIGIHFFLFRGLKYSLFFSSSPLSAGGAAARPA
jgi:hypothetical protein